ncbi:MAG TPA: bile acid:sodium symporter [Spirochaetia bacterium]|nr:bile acid:sodium symporter [Spirochaetia bacterium]
MFTSVATNLRKNLLWYSLGSIAVGWVLGLAFPSFAAQQAGFFKTITTVLVFFMIYPMMVNLNIEKMVDVAKDPKAVLLSLAYNFIVTPAISFALAALFFRNNPEIALGFWLVMLIPGSSMSLGYTGLTKGNLEVGAIALGLNFIIVPFILPFVMHILGGAYNVHVPLGSLIWTVVLVLLLPMVLGDLTRRLILRGAGKKGYEAAKPLLSTVTMVGMLLVVAVIFFTKAELLAEKWRVLVPLAAVTLLYLLVMFPVMTWINHRAGLSYEEHMGIAFLSTGKNNGTAIAIALMAFNPLTAIPAATLPLFQIIFSIVYVQLAPRVKRYFGARVQVAGAGNASP